MKVLLLINGKRQGPIEMEALKEALHQGKLPTSALAWDEGGSQWVPVNALPALHPPPLPNPEGRARSTAGQWYYFIPGGKTNGPISKEELQRLVISGTVP